MNAPQPPADLVMPHAAQVAATSGVAAAVALMVFAAVMPWVRRREPTYSMIMVGGLLAALNEPIVDVLGLCWHRGPGQWNVFTTFDRPIPAWAVLAYPAFFGGGTCLVLVLLRRTVTRRVLWLGFTAVSLLDFAIEIPVLHAHLYVYYGHQPFTIGGLPPTWLFMNTLGCLFAGVAIHVMQHRLTGVRTLAILPIVPAAQFAALFIGLPSFSVLNTGVSGPATWTGTAGTVVLGAVTFHWLAGLIERQVIRPLPPPAAPAQHPIRTSVGPTLAGVGPTDRAVVEVR